MSSAARRALVVGIDTYAPPAGRQARHAGRSQWTNLEGAAADARAIRALLVARYGFGADDVRLLLNRDATRDAISEGLTAHLGGLQAGDSAFFFFAGHGSQVRNSKSLERNRLDESIVPADSWRGVPDLRDKELARHYDDLLGRGVQVVVALDSCHSGSASRGPAGPLGEDAMRPRKLHPSAIDAADDYAPAPREGRDFLSLSATQDFQLAWETRGDDGRPRGLFSLGLQQAMLRSDPTDPVHLLARRVRASVVAKRGDQDPDLEADSKRRHRPLFGDVDAPGGPARTVVGVQGRRGAHVRLGAGSDVGLTPGAELMTPDGSSPSGRPLRLRVTEVLGLAESLAEVVEGTAGDAEDGALVFVSRWGAPTDEALRLYVPPAEPSIASAMEQARRFATQAQAAGAAWVRDLDGAPPSHTLRRRQGAWVLISAEGSRAFEPGQALEAAGVGPEARLFVELPPTEELVGALRPGPRARLVSSPPADYRLVGRLTDEGTEYAWVRPWGGGANETTLPQVTDWAHSRPGRGAAVALSKLSEGLGCIHHWLTTPGAPEDGSFPYGFSIYDHEADDRRKRHKVGGRLTSGRTYNLAMFATRDVTRGPVEPRWVYVVVVDKTGASTLLYPFADASGANRFPPHGEAPRREYLLHPKGWGLVQAPYGVDTYILISTRTKLPDPQALLCDAVRTRGAAPAAWAVRRIMFESAAP